jgi:hypothetical protein
MHTTCLNLLLPAVYGQELSIVGAGRKLH